MKARFIPLLAECFFLFTLICIVGALCPPLLFAFFFVLMLSSLGKGSLPEVEEEQPIQEESPISKPAKPNSIQLFVEWYRERRRNKT